MDVIAQQVSDSGTSSAAILLLRTSTSVELFCASVWAISKATFTPTSRFFLRFRPSGTQGNIFLFN